MYSLLIFFHSLFRWLVVISLVFATYTAWRGWLTQKPFTKTDNVLRHWTATIAHIQLAIGLTLYFQSPVVKYFISNVKEAVHDTEFLFFGLIHITLMLAAIVILTIGSSLAKRKKTDLEKHKTIAVYFLIALFIIFIAIPWPFSPLANRPYLRHF